MTRQPMPLEDDEQPERPRREPVPIEPDDLREIKAVVAIETGRKLPPLDAEGTRPCVREGCANRFKPEPEMVTTQAYCSDECLVTAFYAKEFRISLSPDKARSIVRQRGGDDRVVQQPNGKRESMPRAGARSDEEKEQRYGPRRNVVKVLSTSKGASKVEFDCGHTGSVGMRGKVGRCRVCRGPMPSTPRVKREPITEVPSEATSERPKREPIPREPDSEAPPSEPEGTGDSGSHRDDARPDSDRVRPEARSAASHTRAASRPRNARGDRRHAPPRAAEPSRKTRKAKPARPAQKGKKKK